MISLAHKTRLVCFLAIVERYDIWVRERVDDAFEQHPTLAGPWYLAGTGPITGSGGTLANLKIDMERHSRQSS